MLKDHPQAILQLPRNAPRRPRLNLLLASLLPRAKKSWWVYNQNRLAVLGLALVIFYGIVALVHPLLLGTVWPKGVYAPETGFDMEWNGQHPATPSTRHLLGTDALGRDILSQLMFGTRTAFMLATSAALVTSMISLLVGAVSAYYRGWVDAVFSHLADALLLLPAPIFMVILALWKGDSLGPVSFGVGYGLLVGLSSAAIVMRAQGLVLMRKEYIDAARVAGGNSMHIIWHHLLPPMLPLAAVQMVSVVAGVVIADSFIAWFGVGTTFNRINWGAVYMFSSGLGLGFGRPNLLGQIASALALSFFAGSFYLIARGLQDVAEPQRSNY